MTGVPLRSVPTGPDVDRGDVDIGAETLDADLEPDPATMVLGSTAVVVAASLLDFLR